MLNNNTVTPPRRAAATQGRFAVSNRKTARPPC